MEENPAEARSFADVLRDLVGNVQEMIRCEIRLARAELGDEARKTSKAVALTAGGMLFSFYALNFLFFCLMFALALILPLWLSALLVGAVLSLVAAVLVSLGRGRWKQIHAIPEQTKQTAKENLEWRPRSR